MDFVVWGVERRVIVVDSLGWLFVILWFGEGFNSIFNDFVFICIS